MRLFRTVSPRPLALACALALSAHLALAPVAFAADPVALPKGMAAGPCVEGICEYTLENGLRVLLFPDNSKPTVTVNIAYNVGSVHENYGETGMAHLLEHLLFKGTPKHPRHSGRAEKARHREECDHMVGSHQLFRLLPRQRADARLATRYGSRSHGQFLRREERPRQRNDRGPQRNGSGREQPLQRAVSARAFHAPICGTTTATARSARARTWRTCRSNGCRRSTRPGTARTTPP